MTSNMAPTWCQPTRCQVASRCEECYTDLDERFSELSGGWGRGMQISYKWVPVVRKTRCTACGLCRSVCPQACLDVRDGSGALVQADPCTSEGHCVSACRESAIQMRWVRMHGNRSIGQWRVRSAMLRRPQPREASPVGCGN